jgi:hypothetical protein
LAADGDFSIAAGKSLFPLPQTPTNAGLFAWRAGCYCGVAGVSTARNAGEVQSNTNISTAFVGGSSLPPQHERARGIRSGKAGRTSGYAPCEAWTIDEFVGHSEITGRRALRSVTAFFFATDTTRPPLERALNEAKDALSAYNSEHCARGCRCR